MLLLLLSLIIVIFSITFSHISLLTKQRDCLSVSGWSYVMLPGPFHLSLKGLFCLFTLFSETFYRYVLHRSNVCACLHVFRRGLILLTEALCKRLLTCSSFQCSVSQDLAEWSDQQSRYSSTLWCCGEPYAWMRVKMTNHEPTIGNKSFFLCSLLKDLEA